jgi:MFS family permease
MSATALTDERAAVDLGPARETTEAPAYRWRWVVLAIVLIAEIMDLLDSTVITISAPTVLADLGGTSTTMQWWAAGYTLASGVFMIVGGRLGDVFGSRRVFLIGIIGFTLASAACALAPSPDVLIATRVLQGGFGALLIPQGLGSSRTSSRPRSSAARSRPSAPLWGWPPSPARSSPAGSSPPICSAPAGA